jgi:peptidoglycan/LPS O-acetylase OafA/YrhL
MWPSAIPAGFGIRSPSGSAFVGLSGFLIPESLQNSRSIGHFAWKRALRTIPVLLPLMLTITAVIGPQQTLKAIIHYVTAGYVGTFQGYPLPLWSLGVEDFLYLCAALLFVAGLQVSAYVILAIIIVRSRMFLIR